MRLCLAVVAVALVVALMYWFGFAGPDDYVRKPRQSSLVLHPRQTNDRTPKAPIDNSNRPPPSQSDLDRLIATSADKLGSTVAAFLLTLDDKYLDQLAQFPDSPIACTYLAMNATNANDRLKWARQLQSLQPGNAWGWATESKALLHLKDLEGSVRAAQAAIDKGSFQIPEREASLYLRSALTELGANREQARREALESKTGKPFSLDFMGLCNQLWKAQNENSASEEDKVAAASMQMHLVAILNKSVDGSLDSTIAARSVEQQVLKQLPGDTEYGQEGFTVADRLSELSNEGATLVAEMNRSAAAFNSASQEIKDQYFEHLDLEGEAAARQWLLRVGNQQ